MPSPDRRTRRRDRPGEHGAVATELAVLMPLLILLVLIPVQIGLWWHAAQAAQTAAEEGLDAAQVSTGTATDGHAAVQSILGQAGNLDHVSIDIQRGTDTVTVTVTGQLGFSIFPGSWTVNANAAGPVERFVPPDTP